MTGESVLISAGEASGDAVGAGLLNEMRSAGFAGEAWCIGGVRLKASGANVLCDSTRWSALGIYQSLKVLPRVFADYLRAKRWLSDKRPGLVIGIDFGAFNVTLLRFAKKLGLKTLYFMPPGSWRRDRQGKDLPKVADRIATPFEWSAEILNRMGASAEWVGHPILQLAGPPGDSDRDVLAVLPGSRRHEISYNLPVIADAVGRLEDRELLRLVIVAAPTTTAQYLESEWRKRSSLAIEVVRDTPYETLKRARAAIICSGTATLEAAVCRSPMVVVYRGDKIMELEYRLRRPRFDHIALPSILLRRAVVPELVQWAATPERLAKETRRLLANTPERAGQLKAFEELQALLGPPDALTRTARIALDMLNG
ncbi:MAG: hypothetical protein IH851_07125 [Armatimonadetes bacterium]|nr:hypothetical protein [Armatimonadota bacterium]